MSDLGKKTTQGRDGYHQTEVARWWTVIILGLGALAAFVFGAGG